MKVMYVHGKAKNFIKKYNMTVSGDIMGVYVPLVDTAYIFLDEISHQAFLQWLASRVMGDQFKGKKGLQRYYIRLRRLVEFHEYAHHLQHIHGRNLPFTTSRLHNEHVADRYARLRYAKEYRHPAEIEFDRRHLKPEEVLK